MESVVNRVVLPGDVLCEKSSSVELAKKLILGPGLQKSVDTERDVIKVCSTKCGVVRVKKDSQIYYVDSHQKRYIPVKGENVIGVVLKRGSDDLVVDVGSSEPATLQLLAFEGATKRNKPIIKVGDLIYAKILAASKDMEPELVCVNRYGKSDGLGVLPEGGFMFTVSLQYARKLLSPSCTIVQKLGERIRFEITIGLNGRVWVKAPTVERTLCVTQALNVLEFASVEEVQSLCNQSAVFQHAAKT